MKRPERIEQCFTDIRDYIEELEETVDSLGHLNETMCNTAKKGIQELESRLAQVERERDAAVADMHMAFRKCDVCCTCKYEDGESNDCMDCIGTCNWQWRGVCEENTKEEAK